jgi:serine O-acetyltransferase
VVGVPGRVVRQRGLAAEEENNVLEHGQLPDPEGQAIDELTRRVERLEDELRELREKSVAKWIG